MLWDLEPRICFRLLRVAIILFALGIEKFLQPFRCSSFGHGKRKPSETKLTDFNAPYIFPFSHINF